MNQRNNHDLSREKLLRVSVAVALNILKETPPELAPRNYTKILQAVLRPSLSLAPQSQAPTVVTASFKKTSTTPHTVIQQVENTASQQGNLSSIGLLQQHQATFKERDEATFPPQTVINELQVPLKPPGPPAGTVNNHPQPKVFRPLVTISVKPIEELTQPVVDIANCANSQNNSVELLEDAPLAPSSHERTLETEETVCGKTNEKQSNRRNDGNGTSVITSLTRNPDTVNDNSTHVQNVMLRDGDVCTRRKLASDQSSNRKDASSTSQTRGVEATHDIANTCCIALDEVIREVEAGLKGAALGSAYDWSKCSYSVKTVQEVLRRADSIGGRIIEDSCLTFLKAILASLVSASVGPNAQIHPPILWWWVIEAARSAVIIVSTWPPLLVRAGNVLLEALLSICRKVCLWVKGDCEVKLDQLGQLAYTIAGVMCKIVEQACLNLGRASPAESPLDSLRKKAIDAALEALDPAKGSGHTTGRHAKQSTSSVDASTTREGEAMPQTRDQNIATALALLSSRLPQESTNPGVGTRDCRKDSSRDTAVLEWNLRYWRSVMKRECMLVSDILPMFGFQMAEIIQLIDLYCE